MHLKAELGYKVAQTLNFSCRTTKYWEDFSTTLFHSIQKILYLTRKEYKCFGNLYSTFLKNCCICCSLYYSDSGEASHWRHFCCRIHSWRSLTSIVFLILWRILVCKRFYKGSWAVPWTEPAFFIPLFSLKLLNLMLLPKHMLVEEITLSTTDLWKICSILLQIRRDLNFLKK